MASQISVFDLYFEYVKDTEPPDIYHRWCLISIMGALLGRQMWIPFGQFRVFPNQFIMLIGDPGARKSTAIKLSKKLLSSTGYDKFSAEKTSKEKFLLDLEGETPDEGEVVKSNVMENLFAGDVASRDPRETFILADEFNDFMRCGDLEFHSMLGTLWDWDDDSNPYKHRLKNSKSVAIFQPTISLLAGNTHAGFSEMFPPQAIGQGFISRMLLIYSDPSDKKFAFPPAPSESLKRQLSDRLTAIRHQMIGPVTIDRRATEVLSVLYNTYDGFEDIRFSTYFTRRYTHLLKLCLICAAARLSKTIEEKDVLLANSILSYAEHYMPKALGEFGKAKNADVANKILQVLSKSQTPLDVADIWKHVSTDLERQEDLLKILGGLNTANKIQWCADPRGYLVVRRRLSRQLYVDFSLLKEYKQRT